MNKIYTIALLALFTAGYTNQTQAFDDLFESLKQMEKETQELFSNLEKSMGQQIETYKINTVSMPKAPTLTQDNQYVYISINLDQESLHNMKEPFEIDRAVTGKDSYLFSLPVNSGTLHIEIRSQMVTTVFEHKKQAEQTSEKGTYAYSSFGSSKSSQYLPAEVQLEDIEIVVDKKAGTLTLKLAKKTPVITSKYPVSIKE